MLERHWEEVDLLVIYIDGQQHGEHHVIGAVGVDVSGKKHVLGIREGATENATAAKARRTTTPKGPARLAVDTTAQEG